MMWSCTFKSPIQSGGSKIFISLYWFPINVAFNKYHEPVSLTALDKSVKASMEIKSKDMIEEEKTEDQNLHYTATPPTVKP